MEPRHNAALRRFELELDGATAVLEYEDAGETLVFTHTFVPGELRGQGAAAVLTRFALDEARKAGKKVLPRCSYTDVFMKRHKEYAMLRAPGTDELAPACGLPRRG